MGNLEPARPQQKILVKIQEGNNNKLIANYEYIDKKMTRRRKVNGQKRLTNGRLPNEFATMSLIYIKALHILNSSRNRFLKQIII